MEPLLTAIAAGLLVGLVYCLVTVRVHEPMSSRWWASR
jgi:xanthosine utilization system XapX-like protein